MDMIFGEKIEDLQGFADLQKFVKQAHFGEKLDELPDFPELEKAAIQASFGEKIDDLPLFASLQNPAIQASFEDFKHIKFLTEAILNQKEEDLEEFPELEKLLKQAYFW